MADTFTKAERSRIMTQVKSKFNKSTELKLVQYFRENKITGWRRNSNLFGKPDFVFPKNKIAVFVDGCFWHGHSCRNTKPKTNEEYWRKKIGRNKKRDKVVAKFLADEGLTVIRIWECKLNKPKYLNNIFKQIKIFDNTF